MLNAPAPPDVTGFPKSVVPEEDETAGFPNNPELVVAGLPKSPVEDPVDWVPNGVAVDAAPSAPPPPNGFEAPVCPSPEI